MRQLIILFTMMMGWASCAFAQADLKVDYIQGSEDSLNSMRATSNNRVMADPPANSASTPAVQLVYNKDIYSELREKFGYRGDSEIQLVENKNIREDIPMSDFQVVMDENGNVMDCVLLKSSNADKDNTVLSYLPDKKFYTEIPLLNGKPCKSVVILSLGYGKNGSFAYIKNSYPLVPLNNDTTNEAEPASSPSDK